MSRLGDTTETSLGCNLTSLASRGRGARPRSAVQARVDRATEVVEKVLHVGHLAGTPNEEWSFGIVSNKALIRNGPY